MEYKWDYSEDDTDAYEQGLKPLFVWRKGELLTAIQEVNKELDISLLNKLTAGVIRLLCLRAECKGLVCKNRSPVTFYSFDENSAKNITNKQVQLFINRHKYNKNYKRRQRKYYKEMLGKCKEEAEYYKSLHWKEDYREIRRIEAEWDNLFYACDFYIADFKKRCKMGDVDLDRLRAEVPIKAAKYRKILSGIKDRDPKIYEFMRLENVDLNDDFTCLQQIDSYKDALRCRREGRGPWM